MHPLFVAFLFSSNVMFLLMIWEFHILYPHHTHFPILPGPPQHPCNLPPKKRRTKEKKYTKSKLCCLYTHQNWVQLPLASPLEKLSPSSPLAPPESINCEEHFSIPITIFKSSPQWFPV